MQDHSDKQEAQSIYILRALYQGHRPGEDERAGRWWWEDPAHKECGLHAR
jgi:hypothetical protein